MTDEEMVNKIEIIILLLKEILTSLENKNKNDIEKKFSTWIKKI